VAHIVIQLDVVLECLELIPESVHDLVSQHCMNSKIWVRTRWHMKTSDYLFNCVTVFTSLLFSNISPNRLHYTQCPSSNWILMLNMLLAFVPMPCQVTWRPNDMVVLFGVSVSPSSLLSSSSVPLVTGVCFWETISSSSLFALLFSSGQSWGCQKGFRHSSHPVNF
jgi:hypothetical protein